MLIKNKKIILINKNKMNYNNYKTKEEQLIDFIFTGENQVTERHSGNDIFIQNNGKTFIGEIKTRNYTHSKYEWILEKDKKNKLFSLSEKHINSNVLYINYFIDNKIVIWDLKELFGSKEVKNGTQWMNKHTSSDFKYCGEKELKDVYYLDVKDSKFILDWKY